MRRDQKFLRTFEILGFVGSFCAKLFFDLSQSLSYFDFLVVDGMEADLYSNFSLEIVLAADSSSHISCRTSRTTSLITVKAPDFPWT